jgi:hypothetical protein
MWPIRHHKRRASRYRVISKANTVGKFTTKGKKRIPRTHVLAVKGHACCHAATCGFRQKRWKEARRVALLEPLRHVHYGLFS